MSVYDLDIKGMRKAFMKFHKTLYGRTVFLLAYTIPFFLFGIGLVVFVSGLIQKCPVQLSRAVEILSGFIATFILGNIYFYSEIRKFCEHEDAKKK